LAYRRRRKKKKKSKEKSYLARNLINFWEMRTSRLRLKVVRVTKITKTRMENRKLTKAKLATSRKRMTWSRTLAR
jgi:hypothetical protein